MVGGLNLLYNRGSIILYKTHPREIEICNMVKAGLRSKEISSLLNVSPQTVEKHRKNIRRKLKLTNKSTNLASFLHRL